MSLKTRILEKNLLNAMERFILRKLRVVRRGKNQFTSSSNILREVPKTDKEKRVDWEVGEEGRSRPVCSLVRRSSFVRGDMVASTVDPAGRHGKELKSRFDEMVAE